MFGLLLRSELLQGSAVRTWNCVLNIANFFRYKFTNLRQPAMPRSRRRHHSRSRSRSRSHSHDRDREPKRRRVESPDSSHHRRSVSVDSESTPQKTIKPVPNSEEISKDLLNTTVESTKDLLNTTVESTNDLNSTIESVDLNNTTDTTNKLLNTTLELDTTSKKVLSPAQRKKHEEKIKLRQEREEQRIKERKEKEEQKRKEREEKEEQKRKEREEKEEQKRKEREEKEEQKRKEREEKEEQKRKEREEKEEQKRKEREEKELKKQQEVDEKNREKKKKEELMLKEKAAFVNFFVPRNKSAGPADLKKPEEEKKNAFMPFEVKSDMRVAPVIRLSISNGQKDALTAKLKKQSESSVLYLDEIRNGKKLGRFPRTWPVEDDDDDDSVILLEETAIGERLDEEKPKLEKMRAKLLKFHENRRPAYFGTWRKKSKAIKSRKPLVKDVKFFDYEVDSDDDWEEEEPGEDIGGSDEEEKETEVDDYEVDNDFFVPHGYLSDEEGQDEGGEGEADGEGDGEGDAGAPQGQMETKLKLLQEEFEKEMSSKTERIKPRLIGCIWENKLLPKVQDAIHQFLADRMMIVCGPIKIQKRDLFPSTNTKLSTSKNATPSRKQLSEENIPDFLTLIHGNIKNQNIIVNEFISYLAAKEKDKPVSKASLFANLKRFAKWKKCLDEGPMHKKYCWYVDEKYRNQYNMKLELPNNWTYVGTNSDESNSSKKKLIV